MEIPKEDSVLKVQRGLHFALSDSEEVERDRISPFSVFKLRETPVFVSSRCIKLNVKQINNRLTLITKHIVSIHSLTVWYFNDVHQIFLILCRSQRLLLGKLDQKLENSKLKNYSGGKIQLN